MKKEISRGFTLIELLIAVTVFAAVMGSVYGAFNAGMRAYKSQEERNYVSENYRNAWKELSRDLRCAYVSGSNNDIVFKGEHSTNGAFDDDRIVFTTYLPAFQSKNGGLGEVEYKIDNDPLTSENGLIRVYYGFPAGKLDGRYSERREIAPMARSLNIEYYDGKTWKEEWDSLKYAGRRLPLKARITLKFSATGKQNNEKTLSFEVPIYTGVLSPAL